MKKLMLSMLAKSIISKNIYMSLATCRKDVPWIAPLFYCYDKQYNFYFISQMSSHHTKHILKNPRVAFAIFDSNQKEGTGNGIQGSGYMRILKGNSLKKGLQHYKTQFIPSTFESFTHDTPYRLFKLTPQSVYVLDPKAKTDKRVKVSL